MNEKIWLATCILLITGHAPAYLLAIPLVISMIKMISRYFKDKWENEHWDSVGRSIKN